ncbi:hypothetical protein Ddye_022558 [Dipteronia dyeriana]|uniref:CGL160/ATPI domain-containing protein n=1 Tax=Dipteronia dyeriana TaxID=168575 RepID=A0AAD9TS73_9ROSI|nr:hypothetical protein Ddye_022558 [Dipteronia dyeriana]
METAGVFTNCIHSQFPRFPTIPPSPKSLSKKTLTSFSILRTSTRPVGEVVEDDVLQMFLKDREVNGDFISRASDMFWLREVVKFVDTDSDAARLAHTFQQSDQDEGSDNDDGFLKLSRTHEWLLGDNSAPINKKPTAKAVQDDRERRKKLNLLEYEALKRELMLLSAGIGTACSGYCLIAFSHQAAVSYAVGVLFSFLYLQLLYKHADSLSKEMVPQIFLQKKSKKIGIRSEDLEKFFERTIKGSSIALSSPRLVIPAAVYGFWVVSHQYFANDFFDFQIVPAMFGVFVYKAACLVQVYRDNEDLQFVFPDD